MKYNSKQFYNTVYQDSHSSKYGDENLLLERNIKLYNTTSEWLGKIGFADKPNIKILEVGCGVAYMSNIHPGWHGVEYSRSVVERVKKIKGASIKIIEADAQDLPYENESFDAIFTWSTLEHVQNPNLALQEIDRLLKPGGFALIAPAWNCRSWTVSKITMRSYKELTFLESIDKFTIPFREWIIYRALLTIPKRIASEIKYFLLKKPINLLFKPLTPRWDLIQKFGHISDDDALADIDPHNAILFFKSRGYYIMSHPTFMSRLLIRHGAIHVSKPIR
jgi:ubiquinone/menaquinone biosynthesis C-methylase UbiE